MKKYISRIIVSGAAAIAILIRHLYPQLLIDTVDLILIILLILPWLSDLIKGVEISGLGKIEFQEVKHAVEKIGFSPTLPEKEIKVASETPYAQMLDDANLLFVGIRIQIEKRLRILAERNSISNKIAVHELIRELADRKVFTPQTGYGLQDLVFIGNQAAHGAQIDSKAALWAKEMGPRIIDYLDTVLK